MSFIDALALMAAIRCRSTIATQQLLRFMASESSLHNPKSTLLKIMALLNAADKEWLRELYEKF